MNSIRHRYCGKAFLPLLAALLFPVLPANALTISYSDNREAELLECDQQAYVGQKSEAKACYENLLGSDNLLVSADAAAALGDVREANRVFRRAEEEQRSVRTKTRWAHLYMQTHQISDAVSLFREALLLDPNYLPAQLGLAEATMQGFEGQVRQQLNEIVTLHPDNIKALLLQARLELEIQNIASAREILTTAETLINEQGKSPLEVYALRASANLLENKPIDEWTDKALAVNPKYGDIFATVAHFYIITYRYREAIDLYKRAVEIDPTLALAQRDLGINYLRINNIFGARYHIGKAFELDPFDIETVNTLRLLDKLDAMRISVVDVPDPKDPERKLGRALVRLDQDDADALEPYVLNLITDAMQTFTERYRFRLKKPMVVELYHDHDDFGVRTVSTPGIGLLGVTFGYLTAMDSPKARAAGEFHWGSTLWHEIAHVYTLEATNHRLPRWMSEGLSVYEEWNTGPLGDRSIPIETLLAIAKNDLLPIEELDSGFVRPTYNGQVQVSYMQAGLLCDFISNRWGHDALVKMLAEFSHNASTAEAVFAATGLQAAELDEQFLLHVESNFGDLARNLDDYQVTRRQVQRAANAEDWLSVELLAQNLVDRDPARVGDDNAYEVLAKAQREQGNEEQALNTLLGWHAIGGHGVDSLQRLVRELRERERHDEAAAVMESINWVNPYVIEEHKWLGDYYLDVQKPDLALREYNALQGLQEENPAAALLGKARAAQQLGDAGESKRQVLFALENAPFYRPAQKLLLELKEGEVSE